MSLRSKPLLGYGSGEIFQPCRSGLPPHHAQPQRVSGTPGSPRKSGSPLLYFCLLAFYSIFLIRLSVFISGQVLLFRFRRCRAITAMSAILTYFTRATCNLVFRSSAICRP